jgi:hypothetical protein
VFTAKVTQLKDGGSVLGVCMVGLGWHFSPRSFAAKSTHHLDDSQYVPYTQSDLPRE